MERPLATATATATATEPRYPHLKRQTRLPRFAVPRRYELALKPDLATCTFVGTGDIDITELTLFLILNAFDLAVDATGVVHRTAAPHHQEFRPTDAVLDEEDEILVLSFNEALPIGRGVLGIKFSGVLNGHMRGFYRSLSLSAANMKWMGSRGTWRLHSFAAVETRRCFPCWDELALKATFKRTLEVPSELIALSNMPAAHEMVDGQLKTLF